MKAGAAGRDSGQEMVVGGVGTAVVTMLGQDATGHMFSPLSSACLLVSALGR